LIGSIGAAFSAHQLGDEALPFGNAFDLDRDRVDRLLHPFEALRVGAGKRWCGRLGRTLEHAARVGRGKRREHEDGKDDRDAGDLTRAQ
jgi:hypothetical protein